MTFRKNIPNMSQGQPNPEFRSVRVKIEIFSKRSHPHKISTILFNLGSCEFLARLENKIRKCLFFDGSSLKKYSVSYLMDCIPFQIQMLL